MTWDKWPFYPKSLTDMIGPSADSIDNEGFVSLLASGCTERLGRPLTILEPELDSDGRPALEVDPERPGERRLKMRRIDQVNTREHFASFCDRMRQIPAQEEACRRCDVAIANQIFRSVRDNPAALDR